MPFRVQVGLPGPVVWSPRSRAERDTHREQTSGRPVYVTDGWHDATALEVADDQYRGALGGATALSVLLAPIVVLLVWGLLAAGQAGAGLVVLALALAVLAGTMAWLRGLRRAVLAEQEAADLSMDDAQRDAAIVQRGQGFRL